MVVSKFSILYIWLLVHISYISFCYGGYQKGENLPLNAGSASSWHHFWLGLNSDSSVLGVRLVLDPTQAILSAASCQHSVEIQVCLQSCLCLTQNKVSVFTLNIAIHQRWRPENLYPHHTECLSLSTYKDTKLSWDLEAITLRKLKAVQDIVWPFHVHL